MRRRELDWQWLTHHLLLTFPYPHRSNFCRLVDHLQEWPVEGILTVFWGEGGRWALQLFEHMQCRLNLLRDEFPRVGDPADAVSSNRFVSREWILPPSMWLLVECAGDFPEAHGFRFFGFCSSLTLSASALPRCSSRCPSTLCSTLHHQFPFEKR